MGDDRDAQMFAYLQEQVLAHDEQVAWSGRPDAMRCAARELAIGAFGALFLSFAVFWMAGASWMGAGAFALFGLPFVAVGAWIISAPVRSYFRARHTYYAITNKRVVILIAGRTIRTVRIGPYDIDFFERTDFGDGSANIRLRQSMGRGSGGRTVSMTGFTGGLWGIRNPRGAAHAISALQGERQAEGWS